MHGTERVFGGKDGRAPLPGPGVVRRILTDVNLVLALASLANIRLHDLWASFVALYPIRDAFMYPVVIVTRLRWGFLASLRDSPVCARVGPRVVCVGVDEEARAAFVMPFLIPVVRVACGRGRRRRGWKRRRNLHGHALVRLGVLAFVGLAADVVRALR